MTRKGILMSIVMSVAAMCASAHEIVETDTVSVKVYFRQGYSTFEPSFRQNGERLEKFADIVRERDNDTTQRLRRIHIVGAASPEGSPEMNDRLAKKRASNLIEWFNSNLRLTGIAYRVEAVGIDWDGLRRMTIDDTATPGREEALEALAGNTASDTQRLRRIKAINNGETWRYMSEKFFPELRSSGMDIYCEIRRKVAAEGCDERPAWCDTVTILQRDTVAVTRHETLRDTVPIETTGDRTLKPFYLAVKTNMLYDAMLVPNIGVEVHLKKGWTLGASWMYAWWKSDTKHNYWRTYGGEFDVRKYFGKKAEEKPLQGHHLGIYGQMLTYDVELGGKGYLGNKWSYGAGLEYGYSLPIAKRLNIDFSIGIGYLGGKYKKYLPIDNHYVWQYTKQRHWFGPTKAEISLVWLIGRGNTNPKKGGNK